MNPWDIAGEQLYRRGYSDGFDVGTMHLAQGRTPDQMRTQLAEYRRRNGTGAWMEGWYDGYAVGAEVDGDTPLPDPPAPIPFYPHWRERTLDRIAALIAEDDAAGRI